MSDKLAEIAQRLAARESCKTELAAAGHVLNLDPPTPVSASDKASRRGDLRRAINAIKATVIDDDHSTLTDSKVSAVQFLGAAIAALDPHSEENVMDNDNSPRSNAVYDRDQKRIGTRLDSNSIRTRYAAAQALGAAGDDASLTDFFRGVAGGRVSSESVRNALSVGTGSAGGFTVPDSVFPDIMSALLPQSSLLQAGAQIVVLNDGAKSWVVPAVQSVPTAAWRNESAAIAESDPIFRGVTVVPRSLAVKFSVSRELLMDSPDMEAALREALAGAYARAFDLAGLSGSGVAPVPRGLLNLSGVSTVGNGANGAAATSWGNYVSAIGALAAANAPTPTAAIVSPRTWMKLQALQDTTGQPMRAPSAVEAMKFVVSSQLSETQTVGTSTDCASAIVSAFDHCAFYLREGLSVQLATELAANTGEVVFIAHARADFVSHYPVAVCTITGIR